MFAYKKEISVVLYIFSHSSPWNIESTTHDWVVFCGFDSCVNKVIYFPTSTQEGVKKLEWVKTKNKKTIV